MSKQETTPPEKLHIKGAGGMIISKSVLNGEQPLKWLFRDEAPYGSGWVAFGAGDDDEYVNNADNLTIIDFNELIEMEPAAYNVYHMPVGTELELLWIAKPARRFWSRLSTRCSWLLSRICVF